MFENIVLRMDNILEHKQGGKKKHNEDSFSLYSSPDINMMSTAAIQERVTAVVRSIPKEAFADSFHKLYERCQPCIAKNGDYFESQ
jgi:hypothetical protein